MKVYEAISFNREILERLSTCGVKVEDCRWLDLYNDFNKMVANGDKVTYAVAVMSERYNISERQVYKIIKRFRSTVGNMQ